MTKDLLKDLLEWLGAAIPTALAVVAAWNLAGVWAALLTWIVVGASNELVEMMRESNQDRRRWNEKTVQLLASICDEMQKPRDNRRSTPTYLGDVPW